MNDFVSRSEISPIDRVSRTAAVAPGVQQGASAEGSSVRREAQEQHPLVDQGADLAAGSEEHLASAAEYARVHARITDILAGLRAGTPPSAAEVTAGEDAVVGLMPQPVIVVPLPPASKDMVERAVALARAMANDAAVSRAAQAHVKSGAVDQIVTSAA